MKSIVVGTAGHIDHGKSALVLALTGTDPDRLKEEKARGITIDLGFAHAQMGDLRVAFVDVPGHERFVKNMLAGVGGIDAVLLVIAADESVMPQTREHFAICRLLQVPAGVIALTKSDLADADTIEIARLDAQELVKGSPLQGAPIIAVSSKTGHGLDDLRDALRQIAEAIPRRVARGSPRLPIDRVFSMRGFGTVVTGTLTQGTIHDEQELIALPAERRVKVRGVQVHGAAQRAATAGHRVALNLAGVEVHELHRGDTLTAADAFDVTRRFDARIDLLDDARPLRHGARVRFHHGTSELLGRVALDSAQLQPGASAYARVRLEAPAVLTRGDRFILRAYSPAITIGGGVVLDPTPSRTPIRPRAAAARFAALDAGARPAAMAFVNERAGAGLSVDALARRAGLTTDDAQQLQRELVASAEVVAAGDRMFPARLVTALQEQLLRAVTDHHREQPMSEGLPREEARVRVFGAASPALFDAIVQQLIASGKLTGRERLALPGRGVSLTADETRAQTALDRLFREAGLAPPDLGAAATTSGIRADVADRVSKLLVRQKTLVKLDSILFHAEALDRLKRDVAALKAQVPGARIDVGMFKERFGVSRKYAIPLLEWLDRERVTRRVGDARVVL